MSARPPGAQRARGAAARVDAAELAVEQEQPEQHARVKLLAGDELGGGPDAAHGDARDGRLVQADGHAALVAAGEKDAPPLVAVHAVLARHGLGHAVGAGGTQQPPVLLGDVARDVVPALEEARLGDVGAHEGELLGVEHRLHGLGAEHREQRVGRDGPGAEAAHHAGQPAARGLDEGAGAVAGLLEHLAHQGAAVDAGHGALGVHEAALAVAALLDAQVADVHKARVDALVGEALDEVGELALRGALGVVHDAHRRALRAADALAGVGPGAVGLAQGRHHAVGDVEGLHALVALREAAVALGELNGARHVHRRGHAHRAVGGDAAEAHVAGRGVKERVQAHEGEEPLVAGGHERELLDLGGQAEQRAEGGVVEVAARDLVEDAAHGLGGVAQDVDLGVAEHDRRERPGARPVALGGGVRAGEVGAARRPPLGVAVKVADDAAELVPERAAAQVSHGHSPIPRAPRGGRGAPCSRHCRCWRLRTANTSAKAPDM